MPFSRRRRLAIHDGTRYSIKFARDATQGGNHFLRPPFHVVIERNRVRVNVRREERARHSDGATQQAEQNTASAEKGLVIIVHCVWEHLQDGIEDLRFAADPFEERLH